MLRWFSPFLCIVCAAYAGGLVASYAILFSVDGAFRAPELRVYPFYFALGIMIFTVPGAGLIAAVHNLIRDQGSVAYFMAIAIGTAVGGSALWFTSPVLSTFLIGAFYGFVTSAFWSLMHRAFNRIPDDLYAESADL